MSLHTIHCTRGYVVYILFIVHVDMLFTSNTYIVHVDMLFTSNTYIVHVDMLLTSTTYIVHVDMLFTSNTYDYYTPMKIEDITRTHLAHIGLIVHTYIFYHFGM